MTFGRLTEILNRSKELSINEALFFVFTKEDNLILVVELITKGHPTSQLWHGIDAKYKQLSDIGGDYAPSTVLLKRFKGQPYDRVTLMDEGDFYRSYGGAPREDHLLMSADTVKDGEDLRNRWGENLLTLNEGNISILAKEIAPYVSEYVRKKLLQ